MLQKVPQLTGIANGLKGANAHAEPLMVMENPAAILHVDKNPGDDRARRQLRSPSTQSLPFGTAGGTNGDIS
jgi:hypothetical protein